MADSAATASSNAALEPCAEPSDAALEPCAEPSNAALEPSDAVFESCGAAAAAPPKFSFLAPPKVKKYTAGGCGGECSVCLSYPKCVVCNQTSIQQRDIKLDDVTAEDIHPCVRCGVIVCLECKPKNPELDRFFWDNGLCHTCDAELQKQLGNKE